MDGIWQCGRFAFSLERPLVMGVLNVTPDSFSDGGRFLDAGAALRQAEALVTDGADIIDVGGESTRAGAAPVDADEEWRRIGVVVAELAGRGLCVSVDTRHGPVARAAVEAGASILNDISGFRDPAMVAVAAACDAGCVVVHMQGEPPTMQDHPSYDDAVAEVRAYLLTQAAMLERAGVARDRICLDAGPGFGKLPAHSYDLVHHTDALASTGYPVMAAVSRKSYIGHVFGIEDPLDRDEVSALEAFHACYLGARVVRTHNVACTRRVLERVW
ncbi:MAG: dihydropteroate synthase [Eggerthellaceae bacterium]|nr:dihydropteroate synthase [Eggerthellaceae bacterium]